MNVPHPHFPERNCRLVKFLFLISLLLLPVAEPVLAGLPPGWTDADIGSPGMAGSAGYTNGNWTVTGGGSDIWGGSDQFNYASTSVGGDGTIIAKVTSLQNSDSSGWSKAGIMFRNDSTAGSVNVSIVAAATQGVSFQWRGTAGGQSSFQDITGITAPVWLKLVRSTGTFTGSYSTDGSTWVQVSSQAITMNNTVMAGLDVTAHNNSVLNTATFTNVSVTLVVVTNPVVTNQPASPVLATSATLNGQIVSTGNQTPSVTIYYGTTDGGANPAAWANNTAIGAQSGNFSANITGLAPNTTYHFTATATNSAGGAWAAPSLSFKTVSVTLPVMTNLPAANVQATSATLGGQVVSVGGSTPDVTLYYGTTDGGNNPSAWANNVTFGAQSGNFSITVLGLATNTTYYFTATGTNAAGGVWATPSKNFTTLPSLTQLPVLTYHYDNTRAGANTNETILTPANVNTNNFGKLFTYNVDGYVYAQALIATNVTIPGKGVHNVLYVATENDTVYAFDADNYVPTPYWTNSFINPAAGIIPVPGSDASGNIYPIIGITATPVIDPLTGTIYVEARTKETSSGVTSYIHRLHALDISTGLERTNYNSPVLVACTNYPGTGTPGQGDTNGSYVLWNGLREQCRPALLLANGMVYLCYASPGDHPPYYGWVFSYDAHTLAQTGVFNTTPNIGYGGIWMTGNGPAADASGAIYLNTGNGTFDANTNGLDYGDSILKLTNGPSGLKLADYFTPFNQSTMNDQDLDVSSAGLLLLPPVNGTNLLLSGSKFGTAYLLNTANLGKFHSGSDSQIVQALVGKVQGQWSSPAYFNGMIYFIACQNQGGGSDVIKQFAISGTSITTTPAAQGSTAYTYPGATPTVSANGTNNGIVWAIQSSAYGSSGAAVLHAYNATNVAQEFYNSSQLLSRDNPGAAVEFTLPTVVNGKVYVGGQYAMSVFGNGIFLAAPTISPNGGVFSGSVTITLAETTPGTSLYYTLDGSDPDTNSILYTGPFNLTNSAALHVVAIKPGYNNSAVTAAGFINSASIGLGVGLRGQYWTNTTATAFANASFNTPATLVRTDAVVNFNWNTAGPDPKIGQTVFTARWTGSVQPQFNETYTFYATADDGVRLWVNGQLLADGWVDQASTTYQGSIALKAQQFYNIRMDYYQNGGGAVAQLQWSSPSTTKVTIPQTQLNPFTNPPPGVVLNSPADGSTYTAASSVTMNASAAGQYNNIDNVAFYVNGAYQGSVSNLPYTLTATGLASGNYALTAVATDGSGLASTSAPVNITVNAGSGQPYGLTARGTVRPFFNMPQTINGTLPLLLSQTGVFSNTPSMTPTNGLIPYNPNTPLWSDAAVKTRWLAVPYKGGFDTPDQQIGFATNGEWSFPSGTVFVKHFALVTDETNPNAPLRRLETRLLVRDPNGGVYGVTYKWLPDNSDAELLTTSLSENILITNATGVRTQTWYYPSPADCLVCHTPVANYVLGVKTRQLNGNVTYPATGVTDNQLRVLNRLGLFNPAFDETQIPTYSHMVSVTNLAADVTNRFRSYIDANCAQCHRPGGVSHASFDARYDTPLTSQGIVNGSVVTSLGIDNPRVVMPHDIWRSILYQRASVRDSAIQMPPLASSVVDTNAMAVFVDFINGLAGTPALAPPVLTPSGGTNYGPVSITVQPPDTNATVYYTLDGTLPTTSSLVYSNAIVLTNSATVSANAFETGFINSVAASGSFTILPPIFFSAPGVFTNSVFQLQLSATPDKTYVLEASTNLTQWVPISTNTPSATPFYLTDPNATSLSHRFYRVLLQQP
ncbi:MAG TPA: chitobiase/beta-hexosaminidase C-terminal domain-containing protein [Verrucomicrobiae bacterium]